MEINKIKSIAIEKKNHELKYLADGCLSLILGLQIDGGVSLAIINPSTLG